MNAHARSRERREILNAARRYRRDGYKVSGPDAARPGFLGDLVPDLIAERDDDKVVVEVKRATAVPGSNEIVELAERVAAQPGWRFEFIAVPAEAEISMPDPTLVAEYVPRLLDQGFLKPAFVMVYAMIDSLVVYATARQLRTLPNLSLAALVRELVVRGVIDEDTRRRIDDAGAKRNMIVHGADASTPARADIEALMMLEDDLKRDIVAAGLA